MRLGLYITPLFIVFTACPSPTVCELLSDGSQGDLRWLSCAQTIHEKGMVAEITIDAGDNAFLVSIQGTADLAIETVTDPNGDEVVTGSDWYSSDNRYSNGVLPIATETAFNFPVQAEDGDLMAGTYEVAFLAIDDEGFRLGDVPATVAVHINNDTDITQGQIPLRILYTQEASQSPEIQQATEQAVANATGFLAAYGVSFSPSTTTSAALDGLSALPNPMLDDEETYISLHEHVEPGEVLLVVGDNIGDSENQQIVYGVAGGVPGSMTVANRGLVILSWLAHAGGDGTISNKEVDLMGETIAHELFHYLGVYHPMDDSNGTFESFDLFDNLTDTENCTSPETCEDALGSNLMFPYTLCSGNSCTPQDQLTPSQIGVVHRYTGVQ